MMNGEKFGTCGKDVDEIHTFLRWYCSTEALAVKDVEFEEYIEPVIRKATPRQVIDLTKETCLICYEDRDEGWFAYCKNGHGLCLACFERCRKVTCPFCRICMCAETNCNACGYETE